MFSYDFEELKTSLLCWLNDIPGYISIVVLPTDGTPVSDTVMFATRVPVTIIDLFRKT